MDPLFVKTALEPRIANSANAKVAELYPIGDGSYSQIQWFSGVSVETLVLFRRIKDLRKDAIRSLGIGLFAITPEGFWNPDHNHPLKNLFVVSPNNEMTTSTFLEKMLDGHDTFGNGLARVIRKGNSVTLYPTSTEKVTLKRDKNTNQLVWMVKSGSKGAEAIPYRDFVHIPFSTSPDSILGTAPIQECQAEFKAYLRLMETMEQAQEQTLKIRDVISVPDAYSKEEYQKIVAYITGRNKTLPFIAFKDWKYENKDTSISAQDQQYNEALELKANMLASAYSVPGWKLNLMNTRKSNGADGDEREWNRDFLEPVCAKFIQAMNFSLLEKTDWGKYTFGFSFDAYNKADRKTSIDIASRIMQYGIGSRNEARDLVGLNPMEGDEYNKLVTPNNIYGEGARQEAEGATTESKQEETPAT